MSQLDMRCIDCGKKPDEIEEYRIYSRSSEMTPEEFVRTQEGTYNSENGHFCCTSCYIKRGQPTRPGRRGWIAP